MKQVINLLLITLPFCSIGQELASINDSGIQWNEWAKWEQVMKKAKEENKFIFVDCYTTWCGPCKRMDAEVYSRKEVGFFFNEKFLSIKVQMDKTTRDNESVRDRYSVADSMAKKFRITSYPTYLFFSPQGLLVHKKTGYKNPEEFIAEAKEATAFGKIYSDPFSTFDSLASVYQKGEKNYNLLPYLIQQAKDARDVELERQFAREYYNYLKKLKRKQLYTADRIAFIAEYIGTDSAIFFKLFYPDGRKVDKLMGKHNYSRAVVDRIIRNKYIGPAVKAHFAKKLPFDVMNSLEAQPNWDSLRTLITKNFSGSYAERNLRAERFDYYGFVRNYQAKFQIAMEQFKNNELDTLSRIGYFC